MPTEIDRFQLTWYVQEVCMHSAGACLHFAEMQRMLRDGRFRQSQLVWFRLTAMLAHAAMISKYVSPSSRNEISRARGAALKNCLGIDQGSDVLPRTARDNVEHFDERIDSWVGSSQHSILEIVLPARGDYARLVNDRMRLKRVLILDELVFVSEDRSGQRFELGLLPLQAEIARIRKAGQKWMEEESPYQYIHPLP